MNRVAGMPCAQMPRQEAPTVIMQARQSQRPVLQEGEASVSNLQHLKAGA